MDEPPNPLIKLPWHIDGLRASPSPPDARETEALGSGPTGGDDTWVKEGVDEGGRVHSSHSIPKVPQQATPSHYPKTWLGPLSLSARQHSLRLTNQSSPMSRKE
jgi:hypothetical protein